MTGITTGLFDAVYNRGGIEAEMEALNTANVDVNFVHPDHENRTALHYACVRGDAATVRLLISQPGIDLNARDTAGATPLLYACANGRVEIVRLLLSTSEININLRDVQNRSALFWAAGKDHLDIVKLLLAICGEAINIYTKGAHAGHPAPQNAMEVAITKDIMRSPISCDHLREGHGANNGN